MATETLPEWAKNLKKLRVENDYTQKSFGAKFGVSKMTVSRWEAGENEPPVPVLAWILEASGTISAGIFFKDGVEI
jgi:transcriptional regulator with XRE-family HTH domain